MRAWISLDYQSGVDYDAIIKLSVITYHVRINYFEAKANRTDLEKKEKRNVKMEIYPL
jgi:hypothetical protein